MRLPVTPQVSTKDGISAKNARLTNCLKESKKSGDKAVVRPGLSLSNTYAGIGNGLIPFDGRLLVVYDDTVTDIEEDSYPWPLDSDLWSVGTTYGAGDSVWYGGILFFSQVSGNVGNTPGSGTSWGYSYEIPDWDSDDSYEINDQVKTGGVTYYSYSNSNTGNTPASNPSLWGSTPPSSDRYKVVGYPIGASLDAAMEACWAVFYASVPHVCDPGGIVWWESTHYRTGTQIYAYQSGTAGVRDCGNPANGPFLVAFNTIVPA